MQRYLKTSFLYLLRLSVAFGLAWTLRIGAQVADTSNQHVYDGARPMIDWPLPEVLKAVPELAGLEPAQNQRDLPLILNRTGEDIKALLETLPNSSAREDITQEVLERDGRVKEQRVQSFNYLLLKHLGEQGVRLEDYRTNLGENSPGLQKTQGKFSVTAGFASTWAHFDPANRTASRFILLGQQELDGHKTYVVAFAQRPGWATLIGWATVNGRAVLILYQGIAWIDVASYQILRMRTDLLAPREDVGLDKQTTEITFGEVRLPGVSSALRLPREIVVTSELKGRVLRNLHRYSEYRVFAAESTIKPIAPDQEKPKP